MAQSSFDALQHFITSRMRMSHVYQPLMLKTMLERGGSASIRQIATAFLNEDESQIEYNALAVLIRDAFPVTPGHLLAIPRRHVGTWFDLHRPEQHAVNELVRQGRALTRDTDRTVAGFNVGINDGESAGQTVAHCHVHLIPRRPADVSNPRGGVRNVIPGSGDYSAS